MYNINVSLKFLNKHFCIKVKQAEKEDPAVKRITESDMIAAYLSDESRQTGTTDCVFLPESEEDVIYILKNSSGKHITTQGARTGLTAGCVPQGGITISMELMDKVLDIDLKCDKPYITVQPGIILQNLRYDLAFQGFFFPPDPTETTAEIGGMAACNSSGARSYRYGSVRDHILELDVILAVGDKIHLVRNPKCKAHGREFSLTTKNGNVVSGRLPDITMPNVSKHTAGYFIKPDMDMIDLFIGSEGTLGIITSAKLALKKLPKHTWGIVVFFKRESDVISFVKKMRSVDNGLTITPEALEFFGADALRLMRSADIEDTSLDKVTSDFKISGDAKCESRTCGAPLYPSGCNRRTSAADRDPTISDYGISDFGLCAIYTEFISDDIAELKSNFQKLSDVIIACGGDPQITWGALDPTRLSKLKDFRHATPACVNEQIGHIKKDFPSITKLGTDMSVPDDCLEEILSMYRKDLFAGGFQSAAFGHIGDNHIHVNIIPRSNEEYARGKALYSRWAQNVVKMGGSVSAEHGIGKLKVWLLKELYSPCQIDAMHQLKKLFDPEEQLNSGNIFG